MWQIVGALQSVPSTVTPPATPTPAPSTVTDALLSPQAVAALIAAVALLAATLLGFVGKWYIDRRLQRELASASQDAQLALEGVRSDGQVALEGLRHELALTRLQAETTDLYLRAARSRSYSEVLPRIFQLAEASERAFVACSALCSAVKAGRTDLLTGEKDEARRWRATVLYRLLTPLAIGRQLDVQLTTVDLRADANLQVRYALVRKMHRVWRDYLGNAAAPAVVASLPRNEADRIAAVFWDSSLEGFLSSLLDHELSVAEIKSLSRWLEDISSPGSLNAVAVRQLEASIFGGGASKGDYRLSWALTVQAALCLTLAQERGQHPDGVITATTLDPVHREQLEWRDDSPDYNAIAQAIVEAAQREVDATISAAQPAVG